MDVPGDLPAFVVLGPGGACPCAVSLHGMCGNGLGHVQAFQGAAHAHGGVLGLQGDIPCGPDGALGQYRFDLERQDARIRTALDTCAAGNSNGEITLIADSQGAYIGERLAERFPRRYTRLVLIGAPTTPTAARLRHVRAVVMISGDGDATFRMKEGMLNLLEADIPSTYLEMPGAHHGQWLDAERVMGEALDWLDANAR